MPTRTHVKELKVEIARQISEISDTIPTHPHAIREVVRQLAATLSKLDELSRMVLPEESFGSAAIHRIREYMTLFVGQVIDGAELRIASGIQEYARRVRQLKVEAGYDIISGMKSDDMRPEQYVLRKVVPDNAKARIWKIKNEVRRMAGSSEGRVLEFLKRNVGRIVESDDLHYVARKKDYDRRVRALRSEKGWPIRTRHTGDKSLKPKQYRLESLKQMPEHDRKIKPEVYDAVLARDEMKCVKCGWNSETKNPSTKAQVLQVHHKQLHSRGGSNNEGNLVTLCNVHHVYVHKHGIDETRFDDWIRER